MWPEVIDQWDVSINLYKKRIFMKKKFFFISNSYQCEH
jgi:hypothetical protein